jgi:hypothetical protein
MCRAYLEEGDRLSQEKSYDKARDRFHAARLRCANTLSLVMIARTYQDQGDLPRTLAYIEEFLAVVGQAHESRAVMEKAAADLRERVPAAQRVSIAAELSAVSATSVATDGEVDLRTQLDKNVENFDWESTGSPPGGGYFHRGGEQRIERASGLFVGANFAYATKATVEVGTPSMNGTVDLPAAFAAELQAGYRFFPFLSVALAPQMVFNLRPNQEDPAHELEVFVQTTGHIVLKSRWDFDLFAAPGYSVLIIPGADDARGLAFRWGGGPVFHLTEHVSLAGEFSHQIGFQGTERNSSDVDMETSFFSLLAGIRLRR